MSKSIRLRILGRDYPLRVQEGHEQAMQKVAHTVHTRMQEFKTMHPDQPDLVAAVIAALTLAEEVASVREGTDAVLQAISREIHLMERHLSDSLME